MVRRLVVLSAIGLLTVSLALSDPVVIEDVPGINWGSGMSSHYMAALYASLTAQGCPAGYDELLVASGAAFRTAWAPGHYNHSSRTATPEDLEQLGAGSAAIAMTRLVAAEEPAVGGSLHAIFND